jgi:hypothetical protein
MHKNTIALFRKMANNKFNVFLSYASENKHDVMKILDHLNQAGLTVWIDTEEMKCGSLDEHRMNGIRNSQVFVACISTKYNENENCMKEFNYAIANKTDIVYVLFEKINGEKERMDQLGVIGFHMARKHFYKPDNIDQITKAIKYLLEVSLKNLLEFLLSLN